jgi:hypothetical protein
LGHITEKASVSTVAFAPTAASAAAWSGWVSASAVATDRVPTRTAVDAALQAVADRVEPGQQPTSRGAMRVISGAQPIRRYGPPSYVVWTAGETCTEQDCAALTIALHRGEVEVIEHGRWGPDNVILRWTYPERTPWYLLAELRDAAPADPS